MDNPKIIDIDEILKAYQHTPDWLISGERKLVALFLFYEKNGLINCKISDNQGLLTRRHLREKDFTEIGLRFNGTTARKWLGSKGSMNAPPSMKILEKGLKEILNRP